MHGEEQHPFCSRCMMSHRMPPQHNLSLSDIKLKTAFTAAAI